MLYTDIHVKLPEIPGKIIKVPKGGITYVYYQYGSEYNKQKRYAISKRACIGRLGDDGLLVPNANFSKYLPDAKLPGEKSRTSRCSCIRIGAYAIISRLLEECRLPAILRNDFSPSELGLFLDLAAYTIVCENNAAQYYPDYAYNHPLFTDGMHIYSDSKISDFLGDITQDQSIGFLNEWNAARDHREKIYISYDSTNKNCQAGDLRLVEFGHPKADAGLPVFNYSVAYDTDNKEPLFYEQY